MRPIDMYRSIFENAVEGIFQTTQEGNYLNANQALARIYGYDTPEELVASVTDIQNQLYVDPYRRIAFILEMNRNGMVTDFVSEISRKDGSRIWISENVTAICDSAGNLLYYEGFVVDVTERKRTEDERARMIADYEKREKEFRERFDLSEETVRVLSTIPNIAGSAVVILESDGRVAYASDAVEDICRIPASELLDNVLYDKLPSWSSTVLRFRVEEVMGTRIPERWIDKLIEDELEICMIPVSVSRAPAKRIILVIESLVAASGR